MKRLILSISTICALTAGAAMAQSTLNTGTPGPTQQQEPGLTNNNLPNPGHPIPTPGAQQPVTENGTVTGTATESIQRDQTGTTTGTTTGTMGTMPETETGTGVDVDVDTGSKANGAIDVDVNRTTDADTDANRDSDLVGGRTGSSLPSTGSDMPLVGLIGLASLGLAFALRAVRN
jgi:LPXTG-motif cell wall-anchored protein